MVENETLLIFAVSNYKNNMTLDLTEHLKAAQEDTDDIHLHQADASARLQMEDGFFIILVTDGMGYIQDTFRRYDVTCGSLAVQTPGTSSTLYASSPNFHALILYLVPAYFDSLPDGHALYSQLASFLGNYRLPVLQLSPTDHAYLQKTFALFEGEMQSFRFFRNGMVRQQCSFLLLQVSDLLCRNSSSAALSVSRSNELFREFKKLSAAHYRQCHSLRFYAERLHVSTTYLSRVVKQTTGRTVRFHLSELICADARRLLECTDMDVKEIADSLGFSDQSVFGKFFARKTGLSPLRYRQNREKARSCADRRGEEEKFPPANIR